MSRSDYNTCIVVSCLSTVKKIKSFKKRKKKKKAEKEFPGGIIADPVLRLLSGGYLDIL